jgi:Tn3 transposase DDE domain-containing protein
VTRGWSRYVGTGEEFNRKVYVFCCLDRVRLGSGVAISFIAPSYPPCRCPDRTSQRFGLDHGTSYLFVALLGTQYRRRKQLMRSAASSITPIEPWLKSCRPIQMLAWNKVDGKDALIVTPLDKLEEPDTLVKLRQQVNARLPRVDLPEVLLEIAARTDFTSKFTHVSERESRMQDLPTSLWANLIAEACNIGLEPLTRNDVLYLKTFSFQLPCVPPRPPGRPQGAFGVRASSPSVSELRQKCWGKYSLRTRPQQTHCS